MEISQGSVFQQWGKGRVVTRERLLGNCIPWGRKRSGNAGVSLAVQTSGDEPFS